MLNLCNECDTQISIPITCEYFVLVLVVVYVLHVVILFYFASDLTTLS